MAIAASGTVSLSDLRAEFVGGSGAISFGDLYRGGSNIKAKAVNNTATNLAASVPTSGTIAINNFYGTAKGFRKTYTETATNQNASSVFGDDYGVDYPKEIVINSGVELGATTTSEEALQIDSGLSGGLTITNNGILSGAGGSAGGGAGGDAFEANVACALINNGTIRAGGGGGGAGGNGGNGSYTYSTTASHANGIINNTSYGNRGGYYNANQSKLEVYGPGDGNIHQSFSGTITFASSVTATRSSSNTYFASDVSSFNGSSGTSSLSSGTYSISATTASYSTRFTWSWSTSGLITYNFGNRTSYTYTTTATASTTGGTGGSGGVGQGYGQAAASGSGGSAGGTNAGTGGTGGGGGAFGSSGSNGATGSNGNVSGGLSGLSGGAAGNYIRGISNVTLTQNGTVQGGTA